MIQVFPSKYYPGPIAADMLLGGIGIQGDGSRYVETTTTSESYNQLVFGYIAGPTPVDDENIIGSKAVSDRFFFQVTAADDIDFFLGDYTRYNTGVTAVPGEYYEIDLLVNDDNTYVCNVNGAEVSSGPYLGSYINALPLFLLAGNNNGPANRQCNGVITFCKTYKDGVLVNHYHCEDGQPGVAVSKVEDVKGGNHGTIIEPAAAQLPATPENPYPIQRALETAWVQTEVGPCYRMVGGYNLDKEGTNLISGTDSDMSGPNNWEPNLGITNYSVNGTSPGKMRYQIDTAASNHNYLRLLNFFCDLDKVYYVRLKATLVSGLSQVQRFGTTFSTVGAYFEFTPTSTEITYYGSFTALGNDTIELGYFTSATNNTVFDVDDILISETPFVLGYCCEDMNNPGYDVDGDPIEWEVGQYSTFLNAGILVQGAAGPETQALTTWTGGAWVDVSTLPFNIDDKEFYCDNGFCLYSEVQDSESEIDIATKICTECDDGLLVNGCFRAGLAFWDANNWIVADGRASPTHTTTNYIRQDIGMVIDEQYDLSFDYALEAGAILYCRFGNPLASNTFFIEGPASGTYAEMLLAEGDTLQITITGAASLSDWVDNVSVKKSSESGSWLLDSDGNVMIDSDGNPVAKT